MKLATDVPASVLTGLVPVRVGVCECVTPGLEETVTAVGKLEAAAFP